MTRGFGIVAKAVMRDKAISPPARALYALLATYADDNGECFPSNRQLAEDMGTADSTVRRLQDELEERGVILRTPKYDEGGRRTSNRIHLIDVQIGGGSPTGGRGVPPTGGREVPPTSRRVTTPLRTTPEGTTDHPSGGPPPTSERASKRRGASSAAPPSLPLTPGMLRWAADNGATDEAWLQAQTEEFLTWARSVDKRFVDWEQAWRNSLLRAIGRGGGTVRRLPTPVAVVDADGYAIDDWRRGS